MRIADFPFRNPTVFATLNFGGMPNNTCTWIRQRVPFHQLDALPLTQLPNDSPNSTSHFADDHPFPILPAPTPRDICNTIGRGIGSATLA